ncbi:conserved hypothetical protein [Ricinus communis]|uniref:DRBM domain-containing protein n=1 Tax=Ricinus communis TaxID=3988 RepID=B9RJY3_RICCO|nr:conserved hypothetical protein [Ricinus communis]|eukprot:XP_002514052.1 protein SICKLE isoform X2 [Ricinus communis]
MPTNDGFSGVSNCYVFKRRLQEYAQKKGLPTPLYETIKEGPSHEPSFRSTVIVNDIRYDSLPGFLNRKAAEQSAVEVALMELAKCDEVNDCISQPVAEAGCSSHVQTSAVSGFLTNPLLESPATFPAKEESSATPRFDFYTNPMAAFSADKRIASINQPAPRYFIPPSNNGPMPWFSSPVPGPGNPGMTPSPVYQMQSNYLPNQRTHQQGPYNSAVPYRSPRAGPFPMHQGTPDAWNGPGGIAAAAPYRGRMCPYPIHESNPGFQPAGSPSFNYGQGRPPWSGNSPSPRSVHGGSSTYSGRGQGQWHGSSRGQISGQSGRRGFHSRGPAPGEAFGPESFYEKSMVEDPWKQLEPVVWKMLGVPGSSNSWLPKSISRKKPRPSESSNNSNSKQSLAEYLAASFNEAVKDGPSV